jgi:hypothetical protein
MWRARHTRSASAHYQGEAAAYPASLLVTSCVSRCHLRYEIIPDMRGKSLNEAKTSQATDLNTTRVLQVLSLEYQTLREELLVRTSGRFQFLGLMTTAAALLTSGITGRSLFSGKTWIGAALAIGVFAFGVACFIYLGRQRLALSIKIATIEKRINSLLLVEPGFSPVLSWESEHPRTFGQRLKLALLPRRSS